MPEPIAPASNRISIQYLMAVTLGIAVAVAVMQWSQQLRYPVDAEIFGIDELPQLQMGDFLVAMVYGTSVVTTIFAARLPNFWDSPGKVIALIFSMMCLLNCGLDLFSSAVIHQRYGQTFSTGSKHSDLFIFGIFYQGFAASVGYIAGIPFILFVIFKTMKTDIQWRFVWWGYLLFNLLMVGDIYLYFRRSLPPMMNLWYFEVVIGVPILLTVVALATSLIRGKTIDWWTAVTSSLTILVWVIVAALKAMAT